jgi:ubiquinone/menaquinone biosynthesis C-methylase UbiE
MSKNQSINHNELLNLSSEEYEKKYVHDTYNQIANHFSATRYKPWPKVQEFLESLSESSIMVDVGCGNGKNLGISKGKSIGCDICENLLNIAKSKGCDVIQCDALNTPFDTASINYVISIAVIHHFTTDERRKLAIKEMLRILKIGGIMLIYVWAKMQDHIDSDNLVGWNKKNQKYQRYYHFFNEGELEKICLECGQCKIIKSYFDKENWACIVEKI